MTEWREGQAAQVDHFIADFEKFLVEAENLEAILEYRGKTTLLSECRGFVGGVRAERDAMRTEATELRASPPEQVLPMSLTTRRAKR